MAEELDIQKHVLRFWESKFNQLKPMKRGGGRRYYRPEDVELLRGIHHLLRSQAYTIKGVQRILREQGVDFVKFVWQGGTSAGTAAAGKAAVAGSVATQGRGKRGVVTAVERAAPSGHQTVNAKRGSAVASGHLSAEDTKALQSVVDQLEAARQSLAKTRKVAHPALKATAKAPAAAKASAATKERAAPKARVASKRS